MGIMLFVGTLSNHLPNSGPFKGCEIDGKGQGVTYSPQKSITGIHER